jgi:hypothetical protein
VVPTSEHVRRGCIEEYRCCLHCIQQTGPLTPEQSDTDTDADISADDDDDMSLNGIG